MTYNLVDEERVLGLLPSRSLTARRLRSLFHCPLVSSPPSDSSHEVLSTLAERAPRCRPLKKK